MKIVIALIKVEIKKQSLIIRELKDSIKKNQKSGLNTSASQSELSSWRPEARHLFIAYGFAKGKKIEQIEHFASKSFDQKKVDSMLQSYIDQVKKLGLDV
jgi:predicted component of type VI protein secretion system